jgi:hypothetical protein
VLLGGYFFSGKILKLFNATFVKKNLLILAFIFMIRMFCKYLIFLGIINIFITIIIMCFLSLIILSLNYNNIKNNMDSYLLKKIYIPLIFIIFILSGISLNVFIISFLFFISIYCDYLFLSTGNPGSSLPEGSGGMGGPNGNNNGPQVPGPVSATALGDNGSVGSDEIFFSPEIMANTLEQERNNFLGRQAPNFRGNPTLNQLGYNFLHIHDINIKRMLIIRDNHPELFNFQTGSTRVNPNFITSIRSLNI